MLADRQTQTAMLALQGPDAPSHLEALAPGVARIAARHCADVDVEGAPAFISRTGYTGEDGFELVVPASDGPALWRRLLERGVQPCGLGARDSKARSGAHALTTTSTSQRTRSRPAWADGDHDDSAGFVGRGAPPRSGRGPTACGLPPRAGPGVMRAGFPSCTRAGGGALDHRLLIDAGVSIGMGYLPPDASRGRVD
jgi:aminomethyltransferase